MPHITNLISDIQLPSGELYEIHDKYAIHDISELGVAGALVFKGTLADCDALAAIAPEASKNGYVYLVTSVTASTSAGKQLIPAGWDDTPYASSLEYVCIQVNDSNTYKWEPLGNIHDAASSTHKHNVVVTGKNSTSTVSGSMSIPKVTPSQKYLTATSSAPAVTNTTANPITGFGDHTTATVPTALTTTTVKNPSVTAVTIPNVTGNEGVTASKVTTTDVTIPNVTGNTSVTASKISKNDNVTIPNVTGNTSVTASKVATTPGAPASWSASVSNGVLSFSWTANTPTVVTASDVTATNTTLGTALSASKITASDVTATNTTLGTALNASKVTATDVEASKVTLGDDLAASKVTTSNVTVATGAFKTTATPITVLGAPTTTTALTSVTVAAPTITLTVADATSTGAVPVVSGVTVTSESKSFTGTAAAQTWSQVSATTSEPTEGT